MPEGEYNSQNEREFRRQVQLQLDQLGTQISSDPEVLSILPTFKYDGTALVVCSGNSYTKSMKCAASTVTFPSVADVEADAGDNSALYNKTLAGPYAMGDLVYISAIAYSGLDFSGVSSVKKDFAARVTVIQPTLLVDVKQTGATGAAVTITVQITDPSGKLSGNALTTIRWANITSLYCDTLAQSVASTDTLNLTIGATYTFTATVDPTIAASGYVQFSAVKTPGAYSGIGYWFGSGSSRYLGCYAAVTSVSSTQVTVQVTATAVTGSPTVKLVAVSGSATLSSGAAIGVAVASGSSWTFNRGAFQAGAGQVQFRAELSGFINDDDFVEIPEVGRDTVFLASRARVTASDATTVTVRVAVADPYPQGSNSATITYSEYGTGGVSPASGGTVTPASTLTEGAGTYIDYTVTRPSFASGTGRVTFTVTAANRVSDSDAVDIPAQEKTAFGPSLDVKITPGSSSYTLVVTYDGTMTYKIDGGSDNAGTGSPQTISVTRNAYGGATIVYAFKCVKDSQTVTNTVNVPAAEIGSPTLSITEYLADTGASTLQVDWSASGMPTGTTYDISYNNGGQYVGSITGQSGSSYTFTSVTFGGSPGKGTVTVLAQAAAGTVAQKIWTGIYHT